MENCLKTNILIILGILTSIFLKKTFKVQIAPKKKKKILKHKGILSPHTKLNEMLMLQFQNFHIRLYFKFIGIA